MPGESRTPFDADMRALDEKSVTQAKEAFEVFISVAQQAVSAVETQAASAKEVGELAMGYAERNIASSFDFARQLLQAKEPKDVLVLHTRYVDAQIATLTEQARELAQRAARLSGQGTQH